MCNFTRQFRAAQHGVCVSSMPELKNNRKFAQVWFVFPDLKINWSPWSKHLMN